MKCTKNGCDDEAKYSVKIAGVVESLCKLHKEGLENKFKNIPAFMRKKVMGEFTIKEIK